LPAISLFLLCRETCKLLQNPKFSYRVIIHFVQDDRKISFAIDSKEKTWPDLEAQPRITLDTREACTREEMTYNYREKILPEKG